MRLRHDLRGEFALAILQRDLLGHRVSFGVAAERIRSVIAGMMQKLADESPPGCRSASPQGLSESRGDAWLGE
jgi:hypothetical protein